MERGKVRAERLISMHQLVSVKGNISKIRRTIIGEIPSFTSREEVRQNLPDIR